MNRHATHGQLHQIVAPAPDSTVPKTGGLSNRRDYQIVQRDDGYTPHEQIASHHGETTSLDQQHWGCVPPYQLSIHLANRPNGGPLATIIEHGSYSTLKSHGSLLSIGHHMSPQISGTSLPGHASHRPAQSLDENVLSLLQEVPFTRQSTTGDTETQVKAVYCATADSTTDVTALITPNASLPLQTAQPQTIFGDSAVTTNKLRRFLHGAYENVRGPLRARSDSLSANFVESRAERSGDSAYSRIIGKTEAHKRLSIEHLDENSTISLRSSLSEHSTQNTQTQAIHRKTRLTNTRSSAHSTSSPLEPASPHFDQRGTADRRTDLPITSLVTCEHAQPSTIRLVSPKPRDVAHDEAPNGVLTPSKHGHNESAQYALDGVFVPLSSSPPIEKYKRGTDTSRNSSLCGTMSTSYSGTVLGVDLDLQHNALNPVNRSSSPMPV